jgi:hypothetical protein
MNQLVTIARAAGLKKFVAEVLAENMPMLRVFEKSGCRLSTHHEAGVVHVSLQLL